MTDTRCASEENHTMREMQKSWKVTVFRDGRHLLKVSGSRSIFPVRRKTNGRDRNVSLMN